jgi:predicted amidohydrolase
MGNPKRLKVGAFQFAACESIEYNLTAIGRGISKAADENVRLLLTQECALCGYPPIEVSSIHAIDKTCQFEAYQEISRLAKKHKMYIALGMVTFREATCLIDPDGNVIGAAPLDQEYLLTAEIEITEPEFSRRGRIEYSKALAASRLVVSSKEKSTQHRL